MAKRSTVSVFLLGLVGAVAGGLLGAMAFFLLTRQGFYAMVLPGALLGLGCGFQSGGKSNALGIVAGVLALLLGLFIEWRFAPFKADGSFTYFITHIGDLKTMTLVLIGLGGFAGFWFGRGREGGVWPWAGKRDDG